MKLTLTWPEAQLYGDEDKHAVYNKWQDEWLFERTVVDSMDARGFHWHMTDYKWDKK